MSIKIPYLQIVNEHSFQTYASPEILTINLKKLISLLEAMNSIGFARQLTYSKELPEREILHGIKFRDWLITKGSNQEENILKNQLRPYFSQSAFTEELLTDDIVSIEAKDIFYQDERLYPNNDKYIYGFIASYIFTLPCVSMNNAPSEKNTQIELEISSIDNNGDIIKEKSQITSLNTNDQVDLVFSEEKQKMIKEINSGTDIIKHQSIMFTYLDFSNDAKNELKTLSPASGKHLPWVCDILFQLNYAMHKAVFDKGKDFFDILVRSKNIAERESETSSRGKYKKRRTFRWEDNTERICFAHAKNIALNQRIYFLPNISDQKVYIGHIGEPLPVSSGSH